MSLLTYTGPCDDQKLYHMPCQLDAGNYREPQYQWIIDPQHFENPAIQRLQMRSGFSSTGTGNAWQSSARLAAPDSTNILQTFQPYS